MIPVSGCVRAFALCALLSVAGGAARADHAAAHEPDLAAAPAAGPGVIEVAAAQDVAPAPARAVRHGSAGRGYTLADAMRDAVWRKRTADRLDALFAARRAAD